MNTMTTAALRAITKAACSKDTEPVTEPLVVLRQMTEHLHAMTAVYVDRAQDRGASVGEIAAALGLSPQELAQQFPGRLRW
jgi:hypothetical protein